MKIEKNEIYTVKLSSGEEIVARFKGETKDAYEIEHPIMVVVAQKEIRLIAGLFTNDNDNSVVLNKNNCVMIGITRDDIRKSWAEATGTQGTQSKKVITE